MPNIRYIRLTLIWHTNNIPRITNSFRVGIPPCGGEIPRIYTSNPNIVNYKNM